MRDTVAKQWVGLSSRGGPMSAKRKMVTSKRIRDKKAHGADKKDPRTSESQKEDVSILQWHLIWFPYA